MIARTRVPKRPLSDFVCMLWYFEGYPRVHAKERILPTGTIDIIINLKENVTRLYDKRDTKKCLTYGGIAISGVLTEYAVIDTDEQMHVMGVNFRPGGAFPFFNLPVSELKDLHVSLEDIWGSYAPTLRDRLLALTSVDARFDLLEASLIERMGCFSHHPAVQFALLEIRHRHRQSVAQLVEKIGLSSRRFIQLFSEQVGLTPKLFCRVQRFQQVIREIRGEGNVELSEVALSCGYFDQAHFIHDFKAFSGISPTEYLDKRTVHLNHVPLED
jgi:AraC-like DNA-binding protein